MSLTAGGFDGNNQLGISPTANLSYQDCVEALTCVPFDVEGIQCISGGVNHSVIIKDFRVFAAGNDKGFFIGSDRRQVYKAFTEINISEESILWAACGNFFTLYLTASGKVILCHYKANEERISVQIDRKAVSVFAGLYCGGIIDDEGSIHITDTKDPHKPPQKFSFESPVVDLVCCNKFAVVQTSDDRVFMNWKYNKNFVEISSLRGMKIEKLSGYNDTCAALTSDGRVYMFGENNYGQLGNGTTTDNYSSFTEVQFGEEIKDVSCARHTLFLTKPNKIFGCGFNNYRQLLKKSENAFVCYPTFIVTFKADQVIALNNQTFILSGTGKLINPAKLFFANINIETNINKDLLLAKINEQKEQIESLKDVCDDLRLQNDANKREMDEMREEIRRQDLRYEELMRKIGEMINVMIENDI